MITMINKSNLIRLGTSICIWISYVRLDFPSELLPSDSTTITT